ncbi:hypothetical protein FB567DRAFT_526958 [Paraphoma chrysanthemicola]|uniref:Uncharacterized protein n=1 Tax=Paraphoma chrysanthemicola TaxID=798071 RepID=A0A8K0R743_9PLEO|nr:hypothetical protein FB567DRAFT_526958 [Paraphoma chrysanthemicola]
MGININKNGKSSVSLSSNATNTVCEVCRRIVDEVSASNWHKDLIHHESRHVLERSTASSCRICTLLLEQIHSFADHLYPEPWKEVFSITCESDPSATIGQKSFQLRPWCQRIGLSEPLSVGFTFELVEEKIGMQTTGL